jgi:hypothetical protein
VLANCMEAVEGILAVERKKTALKLEDIDQFVKNKFISESKVLNHSLNDVNNYIGTMHDNFTVDITSLKKNAQSEEARQLMHSEALSSALNANSTFSKVQRLHEFIQRILRFP